MDQTKFDNVKPPFEYFDVDLGKAKRVAKSPGSNPSVILSKQGKRFIERPNGNICDFSTGREILRM